MNQDFVNARTVLAPVTVAIDIYFFFSSNYWDEPKEPGIEHLQVQLLN